jgi:hypothetical protein
MYKLTIKYDDCEKTVKPRDDVKIVINEMKDVIYWFHLKESSYFDRNGIIEFKFLDCSSPFNKYEYHEETLIAESYSSYKYCCNEIIENAAEVEQHIMVSFKPKPRRGLFK